MDKDVLVAVTADLCQNIKVGYDVLDTSASAGYGAESENGIGSNPLREAVARSKAGPLLPSGIDCAGLRPATSQAIADAFGNYKVPADWSDFLAAFPGAKGLVHISLPGYSADKATAVVVVGISCGGLCGSGFALELRRKPDGHWLVYEKRGLWIS
jgi:hypothetical protein